MDTNKIRKALEQARKVGVQMEWDGLRDKCDEAIAELDKAPKVLTDEEIERIGIDIEAELASADWPKASRLAEVENFKRYAKRLRPYIAPAAGLTVEEVDNEMALCYVPSGIRRQLCARLTAAINAKKPTA